MFENHKGLLYTLIVCLFVVAFIFGAMTIQSHKRIDELEQKAQWTEQIAYQNQVDINGLEWDNQIMVDEVCGEPCYLDPIMHYVSRIDYLWKEVYGDDPVWDMEQAWEEWDMKSRIDKNEQDISKARYKISGLRAFEQCVMQGNCPDTEVQNWNYQCGVFSTTWSEYAYCVGLSHWQPEFRNEIIAQEYCTKPNAKSSAEIIGLSKYKVCP